jgi:hypothetical protein
VVLLKKEKAIKVFEGLGGRFKEEGRTVKVYFDDIKIKLSFSVYSDGDIDLILERKYGEYSDSMTDYFPGIFWKNLKRAKNSIEREREKLKK